MGKPAHKSCLLTLKERSGNSSPPPQRKLEQKAALLEHSPVRVFLSPLHPKNFQHLLASRRGCTSLSNTIRAHQADLSSASKDLATVKRRGAGIHTNGTQFCPDVVNSIEKNATLYLALEEVKKPHGGEAYLLLRK